MTYVDPSGDLPWSMRQQPGGPTGGPSGAPQGGPGGGSAKWLQYLQQMFGQGQGQDWQQGSIPSLMDGGNANAQQPYQTAGLGWAGPPGYDQAAALRRHLVQNASTVDLSGGGNGPAPVPPAPPTAQPNTGPGPGNVGPVNGFLPRQPYPPQMYPNNRVGTNPTQTAPQAPGPYNPLSGGSANTGQAFAGPRPGPPPQPPYSPLSGGSANTGYPPPAQQFMPWRGPLAGDSPANTAAAGGAGPGPLAAAPAAAANPRFIGIDRPNAPAESGPYGRSGLQGTALNLAGLFGGGQPAVNPNAPAANAQPVAALTSSSPGMRIVKGPLAAPPGRMQMSPDQLAAAVSKPNWWQGLGRPDMTPDQLARAVKKPNWYRNV